MGESTKRKLAGTRLAQWLNQQMAQWQDPETHLFGLSGNKLAELTGISQTLIWQILKVGVAPGPDILLQVASFFHTSPLYLFRLTYLPESDATDLDPEIKAKLEHLESILADLPLEVQQLFTDGVLTQAKALRTAMQRKDQAGSEGQQSRV
jgi:transcriptional regulator with XRE-family HTH domain